MGDDSSKSIIKSLKKEWALFLEVFHGDEEKVSEVDEAFQMGNLEILSLEKVREITRNLTEDRKKLNQQLEVLSKELEKNSSKLESISLVGGDVTDTEKRIDELNNLGLSMTEALAKIDGKLRDIRSKYMALQEKEL